MAGKTHQARRQAGGVVPQAWVIGLFCLAIGLCAATPRAGAGIVAGGIVRDDPFTVVEGDVFNSVLVTGTSKLDVAGGNIQALHARGESTTNIGGGEIDEISGVHHAVILITGGVVGSIVAATQDGRTPQQTFLTIEGGEIGTIFWQARPILIRGGHVELLRLRGSGEVTGGSLDHLEAWRIQITGGHVETLVVGRVGSSFISGTLAEITGGRIDMIEAVHDSQVSIFGSGFNLPLGPIERSGMTEPFTGRLTGILSDGTPLDLAYSFGPSATITLVPEPWSGAVLLLAMPLLLRRSGR